VCRHAGRPSALTVAVSFARAAATASNEADQVAGTINPRLVDMGFEFAAADIAHRFLLTARTVGPQQLLQQIVA
jgi:hypothetical protein